VHTFTVADPAEWVALLLFLLTAIITGQLAAEQRRRAHEAQQREREATVLYDVVRLLAEPDLPAAIQAVAERLRQELSLAAVVIEIADGASCTTRAAVGEPAALRLAQTGTATPTHLLGEGPAPTAARPGAPGRWIRIVPPNRHIVRVSGPEHDRLHIVPVKAQERRVGMLLLIRAAGAPRFTAADDRLLSAVAAQLGMTVERARLRREAMESEILRRTDELKTALLNAVSHDLRTPLASILAAAGSLLQQDVAWTEQDRQEFAMAIRDEAERLNRIVGNLLDLSRIEAGSLRPQRDWHDLRSLVDDVLSRLRPVTARHRIIVNVPDDLPVFVDAVLMDQVLSNLIENAIKYTPPGTEVTVAARRRDDGVEIEVADRGPGIQLAALPHIFEPFYCADGQQPDRQPRTGPRGTGLGLAIARGLVEAHGGRIRAENRIGGGARFIISLPVPPLPPAALPATVWVEEHA
jgi:two-component system sensor histidine kinase KdpD